MQCGLGGVNNSVAGCGLRGVEGGDTRCALGERYTLCITVDGYTGMHGTFQLTIYVCNKVQVCIVVHVHAYVYINTQV